MIKTLLIWLKIVMSIMSLAAILSMCATEQFKFIIFPLSIIIMLIGEVAISENSNDKYTNYHSTANGSYDSYTPSSTSNRSIYHRAYNHANTYSDCDYDYTVYLTDAELEKEITKQIKRGNKIIVNNNG